VLFSVEGTVKSFFTWDPAKASINRRKHGVTFADASTAFADPFAKIVDDPSHSGSEERELLLGTAESGQIVVVSFVQHGRAIRLISARLASRNERYAYEEE
jgi:uncharacterized protein